jgi:hypothetical protein
MQFSESAPATEDVAVALIPRCLRISTYERQTAASTERYPSIQDRL